jgi:hypothetical protein
LSRFFVVTLVKDIKIAPYGLRAGFYSENVSFYSRARIGSRHLLGVENPNCNGCLRIFRNIYE